MKSVEDLSSFLTDSIHLELDKEGLQTLIYRINGSINGDSNLREDMYGEDHNSSFFLNSRYQANSNDSSTMTSFFLLDGKLVIEIQKPDVTAANREEIKKIYKT